MWQLLAPRDGSVGGCRAPDATLKVSARLALMQRKRPGVARLTHYCVYSLSIECAHGFEVVFKATLCVPRTSGYCTDKDKLQHPLCWSLELWRCGKVAASWKYSPTTLLVRIQDDLQCDCLLRTQTISSLYFQARVIALIPELCAAAHHSGRLHFGSTIPRFYLNNWFQLNISQAHISNYRQQRCEFGMLLTKSPFGGTSGYLSGHRQSTYRM